ncbi:uncharacterized protein LOC135497787 [Lineus longissimus]|uniref:uncharacterized protein LOC135497787 n=1 Tax=Lineus longissimus TaxID=88925 RepID=UPI002B4E8253
MADYIFSFVIPLVVFMAMRIPTAMSLSYASCKGGYSTRYCLYYLSTECCSSGFYKSAVCCSPQKCFNGYFGYNTCWQYTNSKCCYRTAGSGSSSCCNRYDYSRSSSSSYWSSYSRSKTLYDDYYTAPIGAIIGGVIGGIVLLVLIIVIPVVACGVCAAAANNRRRPAQHTAVITQGRVQPAQGAYVNRGYAPPTYGQVMPPPGPGLPQSDPVQPPPYNQVMLAGPGHAGAPLTASMYPQPGGHYPPPTTVNPPQTGGQYPPPAAEDPSNMKNAANTRY